jgi:hypothetical protein
MTRKNFYLLAAIVGTIVPWFYFAQFIAVEGLNLPLFISSLFVNNVASGFTTDLLISSAVLWVWSFADARERGIRNWWLILPANVLVGLSLALPLYLWMREGNR